MPRAGSCLLLLPKMEIRNVSAMPPNHQDAHADNFEPLVEIDMSMATFGASWSHCDRVSSYLARMVSHNRSDSLLYANLFSSALNELLETAFRIHEGDGAFVCRVARNGPVDRIELTLPCSSEQAGFYRDVIAEAGKPDAASRYREALFATDTLDPGIGLYELAVDYAASMTVEAAGGQTIRLIADLALEDFAH